MNKGDKFARMGRPHRVWAVAACHGDIDRLDRLHMTLADRFVLGDRLLYLGNYVGGGDPVATIDRLLAFRTYLLAAPGMIDSDIVYLRGMQEEIWAKMLQIQFAPNPHEVLTWMLGRGAGATLAAYGGDPKMGLIAAREGAIAINRWTGRLREAMRANPGHDKFMSVLKRAATTETDDSPLLFVHAGLNPARTVGEQGDNFWWDAAGFDRMEEPYENFKRIFRGADPAGRGVRMDSYAVTLDAGCGTGGPLFAAAILPDGRIVDTIQA
jgi:hypothetical protein